jgi:hypothetical protein
VNFITNKKEEEKCSEDSIFYENRRKLDSPVHKEHHSGEGDYQAWVSVPGNGVTMLGLLNSERARKALYKDSGLQRWVSRMVG